MTERPERFDGDRPIGGPRRPPGVLPRNSHIWVGGFIVFVIVSMTAFSGKRRDGKSFEQKPVTGPSMGQLNAFQKQLEADQRRAREEMERLRRAEQERRDAVKDEPPKRYASSGGGGSVQALEGRRADRSLAASSIAFRVEEEDVPVDRSTQIAFSAPVPAGDGIRAKPAQKQEASSTERLVRSSEVKSEVPVQSGGSGRFLSAREGEFHRLLEGTTIQTVLQNALDGSFTGPVKSVVTEAVWSQDRTAVLIPAGSLFLGEAKRVSDQNQTRLAVTFNRLLRPDGYAVDLKAAPGLDGGGQAGLEGNVKSHRGRTFISAGAIGLLGGVAHFGGRGNPYAWGVGRSLGSTATSNLSRYMNPIPTITIRKGHPVMVYLPRDLLLPVYGQGTKGRTL